MFALLFGAATMRFSGNTKAFGKIRRIFMGKRYLTKYCQRSLADWMARVPIDQAHPTAAKTQTANMKATGHNWIVWSRKVDYPAYLQDRGRFLTEFGWQAPSARKLLREYLDATDLKLSSEALEAHEKQVDGLTILRALLSLHYPVPEDFGLFVLYWQLNQADALKLAVMHWRSRMFKTAGCLIWQFNDCWPVISWSLIDYGLNPKPAYFAVKRVCEPIIAPLFVRKGSKL